jgi:hypothetical protein
MMTENDAIVAAAQYVAHNDDVFNAAFDAAGAAVRGADRRQVRQVLNDEIAQFPRAGQFDAVRNAAKFLAGSRYLGDAVQQGVRNGDLPRGTDTAQAAAYLGQILGVNVAPVADVEDDEGEGEFANPGEELRQAAAAALNGLQGKVRITLEGSVEDLSELLGL